MIRASIIGKPTAILLLVCLTHGQLWAQDKLKEKCKTPGAYISISFQDMMSKSIDFIDLATLEKSCYAFGDKSYVYDCIINALLFGPDEAKDFPFIVKPGYISRLKDCPIISNFRPCDPALITTGVFFYRVSQGDQGRLIAMQNYQDWQLKNAPHSFLGANSPPDNLDETQKIRFGLTYVQNWVLNYPDEYQLMVREFDTCFAKWQETNPNGNYAGFFQYYAASFFRTPSNIINNLLHYTQGAKTFIPVLPDENMMRNKPVEFIKDVYEDVYMRAATDEEIRFLVEFIKRHKDLTVKQFYYALMTSDEYKYY